MSDILRQPAEVTWGQELAALQSVDGSRPQGWQMTPQAVVTYLLGGKAPDGTQISAKYIGDR
ncbi:MAG: ATPase, partial [Pseudomonadota bacterium]